MTTLVLRDLSAGQHANDRHHGVVELAEAKAKIRKWRQEVEEKCEQVAESREELGLVKNQLAKVKQENMDLVQVIQRYHRALRLPLSSPCHRRLFIYS